MRQPIAACVVLAALALAAAAQEAELTDYQKGEAAYAEAETLQRAQKYDEAIAIYAKMVADFPEHEWADGALTRIADMQARQGKHEEALATCDRALKDYPDSYHRPTALTRKYTLLKNNLRRDADAIAVGKEIATQFPGYTSADGYLWEVTDIYWRMKDYEGTRAAARAYLDSPTSQGGRRVQALEVIARCCAQLADEEALTAALAAIEEADDGGYWASIAHRNAAARYAARRQYEKASKLYRAAAERTAYGYAAYDLWAAAENLRYVKKHEEAIALYREHLERFPQSAYSHAALMAIAGCYSSLGDWEKCVAAYRELIDAHPDSYYLQQSLHLMAHACSAMKDTDAAKAAWAQIYDDLPESIYADDALWNAAETLRAEKDVEGAGALYERLARDYPMRRYGDMAVRMLAKK